MTPLPHFERRVTEIASGTHVNPARGLGSWGVGIRRVETHDAAAKLRCSALHVRSRATFVLGKRPHNLKSPARLRPCGILYARDIRSRSAMGPIVPPRFRLRGARFPAETNIRPYGQYTQRGSIQLISLFKEQTPNEQVSDFAALRLRPSSLTNESIIYSIQKILYPESWPIC
jgi:hypothetical protein